MKGALQPPFSFHASASPRLVYIPRMDDVSAAPIVPPTYAGFWRRFNAYGIDVSIVWLTCVLLQFLVLGDAGAFHQIRDLFGPIFSGTATPELMLPLLQMLIDSLSGGALLGADIYFLATLSSLYNILFVLSPWQATPGKHWLNCKVVMRDGSRLTPLNAVLRHAASGISAYLAMLPCLTAAFTREKLAPHDMLVKTRVIHVHP